MRFTSFTTALLLASGAIAAPAGDLQAQMQGRRDARMAKRGEKTQRRSNPPIALDSMDVTETIAITPTHNGVSYNSNWAGAGVISNSIQSVTGTFTVPNVNSPPLSLPTIPYGASAWVGIDGNTCQSAILQTGVTMVSLGATATYSGWYEWWPYGSVKFPNFPISAGNTIQATVNATANNGGVATLSNLSTGQTVTHTFAGMAQGKLCQTNAEWIIEDYGVGSKIVPFTNFGTIAFSNVAYTTTNGATTTTSGLNSAGLMGIKQKNQVMTSCSMPSNSSMTCSYV